MTIKQQWNSRPFFFRYPGHEFVWLGALGAAYHKSVDIGRLLAAARQTKEGDHDSAYHTLNVAGDEALTLVKTSLSMASFSLGVKLLCPSTYFLDASSNPTRLPAIYQLEDGAWRKFITLMPNAREIRIPYEDTSLRGYHMRAPGSDKRPLLIMNNGSERGMTNVYTQRGSSRFGPRLRYVAV